MVACGGEKERRWYYYKQLKDLDMCNIHYAAGVIDFVTIFSGENFFHPSNPFKQIWIQCDRSCFSPSMRKSKNLEWCITCFYGFADTIWFDTANWIVCLVSVCYHSVPFITNSCCCFCWKVILLFPEHIRGFSQGKPPLDTVYKTWCKCNIQSVSKRWLNQTNNSYEKALDYNF